MSYGSFYSSVANSEDGGSPPVSNWPTWDGTLDGSAVAYQTTLTVLNSVCALSSSKVLVTWEDSGANAYLFGCVGDITGNSISWGSVTALNASTVGASSVVALSSTQGVVAYIDTGDSGKLKGMVLDISGTTITPGTIATIDANAVDAVKQVALTSSKSVVVWNGSTPKAKAMVLDIASSTITTNTALQVNGASTGTNIVVAGISSSQVLTVYSDGGNSSFATAQVLDISGSTVTGNTEYVFNSSTSTLFKIAAVSASLFVVSFKDGGDSNFLAAIALAVAGTVVSNGTKVRVNASIPSIDYHDVCKADSTNAYIGFRNITNGHGMGVVVELSGTAITLGTKVDVKATANQSISVANLDSNHIIQVFRDNGDSNKGKGIVVAAV